ncbi:MAG: glycosyltransferase family 2 protein, partial [Vicinamibacterales bacterium]
MRDGAPPLVSVVIPFYSRGSLVQATVESVWAQRYTPLELIAMDDASTDNTLALLEDLQRRSPIPMRVGRHEKNQGMTKTLNDGVALSSGQFVAFLDCDDTYLPGRFEAQVCRLRAEPDLMVVYGNGRQLLADGTIGERVHSGEIADLLSKSPAEILQRLYTRLTPVFLQTVLMRREFFDEIGGFDEAALSNDWPLNIRVFRRLSNGGRHAYLDQDFFLYRLHDRNMHKDYAVMSRLILQVFERYTPVDLQRPAFANAYWTVGGMALGAGRYGTGIVYLTRSQWYRPRPLRFLRVLLGLLIT